MSKKPMEVDRYEIRFSGSGGQGIVTAAIILAEAIASEGKYAVCQTQNYGPEARGGASKADIVVSRDVVDYPKPVKLDLLLAMNQASCDAYVCDLKPRGLLIVDATLVSQIPIQRVIALPFSQIARDVSGKDLAANMVALGAVGCVTDIVSLESLEKALLARIPTGTEEMNEKAFSAGVEAAGKIDLRALPAAIGEDDDEV